ncbi:MAG: carbohydrate kinase family protein [bacterium]
MKIGVVGTFIRDTIFPWQGESVESIGGIFFTVSYLANLLNSDAEIVPVAHVGSDLLQPLTEQLAEYGQVRLHGLQKCQRRNTHVQLLYESPQERYEITTAPMPALDFKALAILEDADAVLVNLITGSDVALEALKQFRRVSSALIYLDFHSLTMGINRQGRRYYRYPQEWREWAGLVDVLQLNEMEARTLGRLGTTYRHENLLEVGNEILGLAPTVCHITLGDRGSYLFYKTGENIRSKKCAPAAIDKVVDTIGCGDAFAAGYVAHYLAHQDVFAATDFAIEVSGLNSSFIGSTKIREVSGLLEKRLAGAL